MMNKHNDEHIKTYLKNMPKVEDHLTQEEWFDRVQPYKYKRQRVQKKHSKIIPILSTALLVGIMLLVLPSIIQGPSTSMDQETASISTDEANDMTAKTITDQSGHARILNEESEDERKGKFVLFEISDDDRIVHGGTLDQEVQYTIPLSFVIPREGSLSESYTKLHSYLKTVDNNLTVPYFKGVTFNIDEENHLVRMEVPEDYSIGEGSAIQMKFEDMLSIVFYPYGIEEVTIKDTEGSSVSLDGIGEVTSIEINEPLPANYKYYYDDASEQAFLIPMKQKDHSFSEAVLDLQNNDKQFSIQGTISKELGLDIDCATEHSCTITFDNYVEQLSQDELLLAVESILMTAKSYGHSHVLFDGMSQVSIPGYDFSEPLEVPLAVNPRQLSE